MTAPTAGPSAPTPAPGEDRDYAVRCVGLVKAYGRALALKGVDVNVRKGTVHALIGENGAGKSTCLGVIAGRIRATAGRVEVHGRTFHGGDPRAGRAAGIAAVYQELTIVPALSAQANVFLGSPRAKLGWLSEREMRARYVDLCDSLQVASHPDIPAGDLSVAEQQMLEVLRALTAEAEIILYDEPTASLAAHERDVLLRVMAAQRERGVTQVFVSHNLDDVLSIADRITVFRNGAVATEFAAAASTKEMLVRAMLGRELATARDEVSKEGGGGDNGAVPALRVRGLSLPGTLEDINFDVHPGEVLGIGGLVGSGRTSVLRSLVGLEPRSRGRMELTGRDVAWPRSPRQGFLRGIALVPEDRKKSGLIMARSSTDNIVLGCMHRYSRASWLQARKASGAAREVAEQFGFDPRRLSDPAATLSGGNQQKLLLARAVLTQPTVLLADEPTRGIDVGAKAEVLRHLERLATEGMAIIVVSSELEEVLAIADRILVLSAGRQMALLDNRGRALTVHDVLSTAFGLQPPAPGESDFNDG